MRIHITMHFHNLNNNFIDSTRFLRLKFFVSVQGMFIQHVNFCLNVYVLEAHIWDSKRYQLLTCVCQQILTHSVLYVQYLQYFIKKLAFLCDLLRFK
jgi:hypothetical protein